MLGLEVIKLKTLQRTISDSTSNTYSNTTTTYSQFAALGPVNVAYAGSALRIYLNPDGSGNDTFISIEKTADGALGYIQLRRDTQVSFATETVVAYWTLGGAVEAASGSGASAFYYSPSAIQYLDFPPTAGTYYYRLLGKTNSGLASETLSVRYCRMIIEEDPA